VNVSEILRFGHLKSGNPSYDFLASRGRSKRCILKAFLALGIWRCKTKEKAFMPDGIRRVIALSVLLARHGLLWVAGRSDNDEANANNDLKSTLDANRERAASNDPRLRGAYRYEQGGWVYVHWRATRPASAFSMDICLPRKFLMLFPPSART